MNKHSNQVFNSAPPTCCPSVIIVEDDDLVRITLSNIFSSAGFKSETFRDAHSFLNKCEHYRSNENTCIILDLRLPIISGLEIQAKLKDVAITLPIIFYTGAADVGITVRAMSAGAFNVLEKPLSSQILIEQALNAIKKHNAHRVIKRKILSAPVQLAQLSDRELQIATRLIEGMTAPQTAKALNISPRTVETHRANIFHKLEIHSITNLAQLFVFAEMARAESVY